MQNFDEMAYNLYIGLTKSALSTLYWVALSANRQTLSLYKYIN